MATIKTCECAQCAEEFETTHRRKYCSRKCRFQSQDHRKREMSREERIAFRRASFPICPGCNEPFKKTRGDGHPNGPQVYCSHQCRHLKANRQRAIERKVRDERNLYRKWSRAAKLRDCGNKCLDCGDTVQKHAQRCEDCRDSHAQKMLIHSREQRKIYRKRMSSTPSARAREARKDARRRQRLVAATIESFDPFEIFERDGWRCYLCGGDTPKSKRGSTEPDAPELDHIIPLAKGGYHARWNTACACRACNMFKGDRLSYTPHPKVNLAVST